jgi:toxin ParE1/3/4
MGEVRWTQKSVTCLYSIHEYIAKDSKVYASRFINSLIKATDVLHTQPLIGRIVPEFENSAIREIIYRNYRIVYRVVNDTDAEILVVFHGMKELSII